MHTLGELIPAAHQQYRQEQQQAQPPVHPRTPDAIAVLGEMKVFDPRYRERTPEEYAHEVQTVARLIGQTNLPLHFLIQGVHRAYSGEKAPYSPFGAIISEARRARQSASAGYTREQREQRALSAPKPATKPIRSAYGASVDHECPRCEAPKGLPCVLPNGTYRKIPCIARLQQVADQQQ